MALTRYAPDVYRALDGILLVCKPAKLATPELTDILKERITEQLNELEPRPIAKKVVITGGIDEEKNVVEVPNLADHPLVVGPRYVPWEIRVGLPARLGYRASGIQIALLNSANKYFFAKMNRSPMINIYHITGRFGFVTNDFFSDGRIVDKSTYRHIRQPRLDGVLAKIVSTQHERLFDAANVPIHSEEAYELAKAWPSRPPRMAQWPVIYNLKTIYLQLPRFKIEVTCVNTEDKFLAQLVHEVGLALKSGAITESIKRIKIGPFDIKDSLLVDKELDLQSIVTHCASHRDNIKQIHEFLNQSRAAGGIKTELRGS